MRVRLLIGTLGGLLAVAAVSGCGGDGDGGGGGQAARAGDWPQFGRVLQRTHYLADAPDPPFDREWAEVGRTLIEFPPALANGVLYVADKLGQVRAIDSSDGKIQWTQTLGGRDVTGPAYGAGRLFAGRENRVFYALDPKTGREEWRFHTQANLESSPIVVGDSVYFGSDNGTVYALDTDTGKPRWTYKAPAPVKASPAYFRGNLYFGDYDGNMIALRASDGKKVWVANTSKFPPGGGGGFYSSPAIDFGHIYAARDDGTIYALSLNGKFAWQKKTDKPIYGSPAAAKVPGTPPSIYVGGNDKQLYGLKASNGAQRWKYGVGGAIPGTATVVGHTVYTSSFSTQKTYGIDARDGEKVFQFPADGYTPLISDGERVYLVGFVGVYGLTGK
jgi:outer membrane protein assembly factor BamB